MIWFAIVYNRRMQSAFVQNRARIADINSTMEDSLSGIRVVKSFANEGMEIKKFSRRNKQFVLSKKNSYHYMATYHTVLGAMTTIITIAVAGGGAALMINGYIALNDLLVFLLYIGNFTEPIKRLVMLTEQLQNGLSGFSRYEEMLQIQPDIADAPDTAELKTVKGEICFNNVSFHYNDGTRSSKTSSLRFPQGVRGVVGSSGVGKTTLAG